MYRNKSSYRGAGVLAFVLALLVAQPLWAITPVAPESKGPLSSSFPGPLWQVIAPAGGTASVSNGHLTLNVPGGGNHDALHSVNQAVRVVQPIGNVDFDVAVKIDSPMAAVSDSTSQGLMVIADETDFITFGLTTDGTNINLSGHSVSKGAVTTIFEQRSFREYQIPLHLRLTRTGSTYIAYYSVDGAVWIECGRFAEQRVPTWLGPFASNYNATPSKAVPFVMAVNWFNVL